MEWNWNGETRSLLDTLGNNSSARNESPLMEFFPFEVSLICKYCRLSAMFLTPPEVDIQTILQISPITWKIMFSGWLCLFSKVQCMLPDDKSVLILQSTGMAILALYTYGGRSDINIMGVTTNFLNTFKYSSARWHCYQSQQFMAEQAVSPR